jgi:hypothetical protein
MNGVAGQRQRAAPIKFGWQNQDLALFLPPHRPTGDGYLNREGWLLELRRMARSGNFTANLA